MRKPQRPRDQRRDERKSLKQRKAHGHLGMTAQSHFPTQQNKWWPTASKNHVLVIQHKFSPAFHLNEGRAQLWEGGKCPAAFCSADWTKAKPHEKGPLHEKLTKRAEVRLSASGTLSLIPGKTNSTTSTFYFSFYQGCDSRGFSVSPWNILTKFSAGKAISHVSQRFWSPTNTKQTF